MISQKNIEFIKFISEDPIRLRGGDVNFYSRVNSNPVNLADPLGLWVTQYNAGVHVPIIPGFSAFGINIGSQMINPYRSSGYLEATPIVLEAVLGTMFDIGVSAGVADISGTGGKCRVSNYVA